MIGNLAGDFGNFAAAHTEAQVYRLYGWDWTPDDEEDDAPPAPYTLTLPGTSFEHDVESVGSDDGGALAVGNESVTIYPLYAGGIAQQSDGASFDIQTIAAGEGPKSKRLATPRSMTAASQGQSEAVASVKAYCMSAVVALGSFASVNVSKQQAQFGEMTLN